MSESTTIVPYEIIERRIVLLRGKKVMLSPDLAQLYGVEPRALLQAVRRNLDRFPEDFMFQLTREEYAALRFHFGILEKGAHAATSGPVGNTR